MSVNNTLVLAINGMFDAAHVGSISNTETGVAVVNDKGALIYFHEEADKDKAKAISFHLSKAAVTAGTPNAYQPDWEELALI